MEQTTPYQDLNLKVTGYMLNAELSDVNQVVVRNLQEKFKSEYGELLYTLPTESLHITLMDWVAPLVEYGKDKTELFQELFDDYDTALVETLAGIGEISVTFDTLKVSSGAIFLIGHDSGQFQSIRDGFLDKIQLVEGTKQPPSIIHTTIGRFMNEVPLEPIQEFALGESINFVQPITAFRLVNEKTIPMLEFELVKSYPLK